MVPSRRLLGMQCIAVAGDGCGVWATPYDVAALRPLSRPQRVTCRGLLCAKCFEMLPALQGVLASHKAGCRGAISQELVSSDQLHQARVNIWTMRHRWKVFDFVLGVHDPRMNMLRIVETLG